MLDEGFLLQSTALCLDANGCMCKEPDTHTSRRSAERVSMRLTCHSKKGAFYLDILRITTETGVSIKALHFSF